MSSLSIYTAGMTITAHEHEPLDVVAGRRVHNLLWKNRIKQRQLAQLLGVQESGVGKKLRGERGWSLDELHTIASAFGTTVSYLIGESDDDVPPEGFEPSAFCSEQRLSSILGFGRPRALLTLPGSVNRRSLTTKGDVWSFPRPLRAV